MHIGPRLIEVVEDAGTGELQAFPLLLTRALLVTQLALSLPRAHFALLRLDRFAFPAARHEFILPRSPVLNIPAGTTANLWMSPRILGGGMERFPAEFEDLLNRRGRRLLKQTPSLEDLLARRGTPIVLLENVIDPGLARECIRLLDEGFYSSLKRMYTPIPREALTGMKKNYTDKLAKTVRVRTATFNSGRSRVLDAAQEIGLAQMMTSRSFLQVAQTVTRRALRQDYWARQVICYEHGDYSGPHNDHHPEHAATRNGFVDFHVMFSNDAVAQQLLVYEERGYLSATHDVSRHPSIAVYRLPFWHYTTPLVARPGHEHRARRWLLLGSFEYDPPLPKLEY